MILDCDGPYKIAYLDDTKVFGVGCIREDRNLSGKAKSVFKIVDSIGMESTFYTVSSSVCTTLKRLSTPGVPS